MDGVDVTSGDEQVIGQGERKREKFTVTLKGVNGNDLSITLEYYPDASMHELLDLWSAGSKAARHIGEIWKAIWKQMKHRSTQEREERIAAAIKMALDRQFEV